MSNLTKIFEKKGIFLNKTQEEQFKLFFETLIDTNKKFNLTAITEENEVFEKHFLDSVLPIDAIPQNSIVVDVGSGAGFPALPIKILRPDLDMCLIDSLNKRVGFLNDTISKLKLTKCVAIHSRAEDFAKTHREAFDFSVARAVAPLNTLVEYLLPLTKVGGSAIIYKSTKLDEELKSAEKAIKTLGGKVEKVEKYIIGEKETCERNILFIKKIEKTPSKYPRPQNLPKTKPI